MIRVQSPQYDQGIVAPLSLSLWALVERVSAARTLQVRSTMQPQLRQGFALFTGLWLLALLIVSTRLVSAQLAHAASVQQWKPATATWYGSPEGDGSDGEN